ncbi:hypothetical protein DER46DRAFT_502314 [Fusarium sp. MPI-SDFR-AT-0072]|nr:hypothetical protein DER46DRAFT_502314 [Fusarium sp. MPI-SDFR-AT-0072]
MSLATPNGGSSWKSINHFSMLPCGWIPNSGLEFFALFITELEKRWFSLCDNMRECLRKHRDDQMDGEGKNDKLIRNLADLARDLSELRHHLQVQFREADRFLNEYRQRHDEHKEYPDIVRMSFKKTFKNLDEIDQTVRDLLEFEFAWVSINESLRSTSIATSAKRLSWVTFIFLPAMFASVRL